MVIVSFLVFIVLSISLILAIFHDIRKQDEEFIETAINMIRKYEF